MSSHFKITQDKTTALAARPEPTLIHRIAAFIKRLVFLQDERLYFLLAVWVIATHMFRRFEYMGYLFVHSSEPQSGKSRLLEVLDLLVSSPNLFVAPTEAVLFRTAASTQLLDEVDSWTIRDQLRTVLNAGFRNGGTVPRTERNGDNEFHVVQYPVYGPRALAGIGTKILDQTTKDRTFIIGMARQTKGERRERLTRTIRQEAQPLKRDIEEWVKNEADLVAELYEGGMFPYLENFRDRTIDVSQPLAAIVDIIFWGRSDYQEALDTLVYAISVTRKDQEGVGDDHALLRELLRLNEEEDPLIGSPTELAERCTGLPEPATAFEVSALLRKFNVERKSVRKDGTPKYCYILHRAEIADLVKRYASGVLAPAAPSTSENEG